MKNKELDNILDQVTSGIHSEQIEDRVISEASGRVWSRLEKDTLNMSTNRVQDAGVPVDRIEGCRIFNR
jgi:hypothetical protein